MKRPKTIIKKWTRLLLLFLILSPQEKVRGASGCVCLCSVLFNRGGEEKLCRERAIVEGVCKDWNYPVSSVTSKQECLALGEELTECKGVFKDKKSKNQWVAGEGARYHTCRFF